MILTRLLRCAVLAPALVLVAAGAQAQAPVQPPGQAPIQSKAGELLPDRYTKGCKLLVPADAPYLQPKRLKPQEVPAKNAAGCLSPADAIYGADGCPLRLCPNPQGMNL